jgi:4-hydroxybenzoate polyprenyltransferase
VEGGTGVILRQLYTWGAFVKFSHTIFALPFALASMAVAARDHRGWPGWRVFGMILLAMVSARTCAMTFNRIADRHFDQLNPRTANRHLPAGEISMASAWTLWALSAAGLVVASYFLNWLCFWLSPLAVIIICFYSWTKRFTDFTHLFLGLALAIVPIGAWLAVKGTVDWWPLRDSFALPLILAGAVFFWLVGFDIIYALQDYEFDRRQGLGSLVVRWGPQNALQAAFLSHMLMWGFLAGFGLLSRFRVAYFVALAIIFGSLLFEHWLARRRGQKWIHTAFFRLNALISLVFFTAVITEVVFPGFRFIK